MAKSVKTTLGKQTTRSKNSLMDDDGQEEKEEDEQAPGFTEAYDNLQKQIAAFEKLLQHAMNRFSREKLFNMLKLLSRNLLERKEITDDAELHVTSIEHLKTAISRLAESHVGQKHVREDEKHLVHYFTTFFDDLQYLSELKKYFDEKIYLFLYEYFYDPIEDVMGTEDLRPSSEEKSEPLGSESKDSFLDVRQSIDPSSPHPLIGREQTDEIGENEEEIVFDFLSKQARLSHAVMQMYKVNKKWEAILDEHNPHLKSYDPDSKYELVAFTGYARYEPVLRLLPDIFVKAYKSIEMAKLWWAQANKVFGGKPIKRRGVAEYKRQEAEFERHIVRITEDIKRFEETLTTRTGDLSKLHDRESRFQELSEQCEKLEERKDAATQAYNAILNEVQQTQAELDLYQRGTTKYKEIEGRLKDKDKKLNLSQDELKILAFHFHIVKEDFNLELELQPHLIRYKADIESKIEEIKQELKVKQTAKRETEKRLVLLKSNCDKMREIMQRYDLIDDTSPSAVSSRENTNAKDVSHSNTKGNASTAVITSSSTANVSSHTSTPSNKTGTGAVKQTNLSKSLPDNKKYATSIKTKTTESRVSKSHMKDGTKSQLISNRGDNKSSKTKT